ncbi:MAG: DUF4179 domain-containing protein [Gordonibacter sp.]
MSGEYKEAMSQLKFSEEAKTRMARDLAEAGETTTRDTRQEQRTASGQGASDTKSASPCHRSPMRQTWRVAAACGLAAAFVVALGGAAYATGALRGVTAAFDDVFGGPPAQTEIVEKIGRPIGASASADGITVTADSIIGDKFNYVIVYNVEKDDGTPFDVEPLENGYLPLFFEGAVAAAYESQGGGGSGYFFDAVPGDNAIQYVSQYMANMAEGDTIIGKTLHVDFGKLVMHSGEGDPETVSNGPWKMKFVVNYEDTSKSIDVNKSCVVSNMKASIDQVTLSPIAINVSYTVEGTPNIKQQGSGRMSDHNDSEYDRFTRLPLVLNMKDGSHVELVQLNMSEGLSQEGDLSRCRKSVMFDQFLNLDDVRSITVGGVEIPCS